MDFENLVIETPAFVLQGRVARGAALLDERHPGWASRIDVDTLEGTCVVHGVLGQLFGPDPDAQMEAIGFSGGPEGDNFHSEDEFLEASHAWASQSVELGFFTWVNEFREPPAFLREMAEFMGTKLPRRVPVPRDDDTVALECSTLAHAWREEIARR